MKRRNDTSTVGDNAELEAARLLTDRGWSVTDLNAVRRNHRLHDLIATKGDVTIRVSVKHARTSKRHVRLGKPAVFKDLADDDFVIVFVSERLGEETDISAGRYHVWIVPGSERHTALDAHIHYYGGNELVAYAQDSMMIKDKRDTPGGRSKSGAAFQRWATYRDRWDVLPA